MSTEMQSSNSTAMTTGDSFGEGLSQDDLMIPKLHLVQDMSKYYKDAGLKVGEIVNSLTMEPVAAPGTALEIIPLKLAQFWGEVPVKRGTGIRARRYPITPDNVNATWGAFVDEEGLQRRRRKEHDWLCLLPSDPEGLPVSITFRDTSFTAAKKLNTFALLSKKLGKPAFHTSYDLFSKETTNDQGTFFVFTIGKKRAATESEIEAAKIWMGSLGGVSVDSKEEDEAVPY